MSKAAQLSFLLSQGIKISQLDQKVVYSIQVRPLDKAIVVTYNDQTTLVITRQFGDIDPNDLNIVDSIDISGPTKVLSMQLSDGQTLVVGSVRSPVLYDQLEGTGLYVGNSPEGKMIFKTLIAGEGAVVNGRTIQITKPFLTDINLGAYLFLAQEDYGPNVASGQWRARLFTRADTNIEGVTLDSVGLFTLPAGIYIVSGYSNSYRTNHNKVRLLNVTLNEVICYGSNAFCREGTGYMADVPCILQRRFTLAAPATIAVQQYYQTAYSSMALNDRPSFYQFFKIG